MDMDSLNKLTLKNKIMPDSSGDSRSLAGDHGNTVHALKWDFPSNGPLRTYRLNPVAGEPQISIQHDFECDN